MTSRLDQDVTLAAKGLAQRQDKRSKLETEVRKQRDKVAALSQSNREAIDAATKHRTEADESSRIAAVLNLVRSELLAQGSAGGVNDEQGMLALLKVKLENLTVPAGSNKPSADDIALARRKAANARVVSVPTCSEPCTSASQLNVVDELIASLRAQRVRALAQGDVAGAEYLLAAVNVAYEQRTSMIYLRPASDYLRSVHTNSDLQNGGDPQHRNMLIEWLKYIDPTSKLRGTNLRKDQLDKLNWQNINTVNVGGGGFTNFVLAKDDVGNWYVKAYSSDPEAIFKSATSLALFNAGGRLNANLLKRHDIQMRIDGSSDAAEKTRLRDQLDGLDSQDGAPLLALRARYAERYAQATRATALDLQQQLTDVSKAVDKLVSGATAGKDELCKLDEFKQGLADLDNNHLSAPRDKLGSLLPGLGVAEPAKQLVQIEAALQAGLLALNVYGNRVFKTLDDSPAANCSKPDWKRKVADAARVVPRSQLLRLARERRDSIERYEEALLNISQVAAQK